ncbi:MAG: HD domain-containing protein [Rhodothermaceae bacterium]|nr:HD domain-containing protein [Rhodothermaceae bacterium]MYG70786.1 HD domain-containing protein [Rhodothermaceae bacterium]MYJ44258.1 HD domain-containing protein [Rhodothermaceae bacterium]
MARDLTVLADPVHGFIKIPQKIIQSLLESPEVQRLRRIKQLGMGSLVFPAAEHSRFPHALGAMGLLSVALDNFEAKGTRIEEEERLAAMAAILLHDIGHSPFSHTLESELVHDTKHEEISIALVKRLKSQMGGLLDITIAMLEGIYEKPFFNALISSQLDMDRLDYLCRDSHFTGVAEGRIGVGRILRTLCVHPNDGKSNSRLAIESKGVYAVENVLIARRLMYWQVYVHKTVIAADHALVGAIDRARDLIDDGNDDAVHGISPTLYWFLKENPDKSRVIEDQVLTRFLDSDDSEVIYSLKQWCTSSDRILADLSRRIISRDLFRCTFLEEEPSDHLHENWKGRVTHTLRKMGITSPDAHTYYLKVGKSSHAAYKPDKNVVHVLSPQGNLSELGRYADGAAINALTKFIQKPYACHPKTVELEL